MAAKDKTKRLEELKELVIQFCTKHLNEELTGYVLNLLDRLGRKRTFSITGGKPEIWAAAIIHVIARLNFLYDKENPLYLTFDEVTNFFNTKKSTIGQKATLIEKNCNIKMGETGLCSEEISQTLEFVETPEGFILPKSSIQNNIFEIKKLDEEESKELEAQIAEMERQKELELQKKKELRDEKRRQLAAEKRKQKFKNQTDLFG